MKVESLMNRDKFAILTIIIGIDVVQMGSLTNPDILYYWTNWIRKSFFINELYMDFHNRLSYLSLGKDLINLETTEFFSRVDLENDVRRFIYELRLLKSNLLSNIIELMDELIYKDYQHRERVSQYNSFKLEFNLDD
jgi:hypothetical protein